MLNALLSINWLAVLAASVLNFLLGGVWFMVLFKRQYAVALELDDAPDQKPGLLFIVGPFLCGLVTIATTAFLLRLLSISDLTDGLILGAIVGLGFIGATTVNIAINPKFPRPFFYSAINVPYFLIASLIASAVLVLMA
ncbi:MAG: DUF1761 domain-containing protein [Brevundimonas sp.]|uniref:DUF1761 domain-containing protein n=1 Tax=Brevundimonas sp. TaxID=1871086 RepID=UPI0027325E26|nr:DUF1761 domain-containing protein [Brevundimonas sp.]MDP3377391.1 DUF1761 domain-containing protein [Brevundimonas sp.]